MRRRAALAGAVFSFVRAQAQTPAGSISGNFTLADGAGKTITNHDFPGRYLLVFFGYTNCPDICPVTLERIARALALLGPQACRLQPIFITVDPARDSPATVSRYTALFSPDILGLSGSPKAIAQAIAAFHVYAGPADPHTGAIAHGALLYLLSPDGTLVAALPNTMPAPALAAKLAALMGPS